MMGFKMAPESIPKGRRSLDSKRRVPGQNVDDEEEDAEEEDDDIITKMQEQNNGKDDKSKLCFDGTSR